MTGRVKVNPERVTRCLAWLHFVLRSTQRQHPRLDRVDVINGYVEVELLRPLAIRPGRRSEPFHQLERQTQPVHRKDDPILFDERDLPAEDSTVELGECLGVRAIKDHGAHPCERHSPAVCHGVPRSHGLPPPNSPIYNHPYLVVGHYKYWTMGPSGDRHPPQDMTVINRALPKR